MPRQSECASHTIAEMREYASFSAEEQAFIERALDIGLARGDAFANWCRLPGDTDAIRGQYLRYRELRALQDSIPEETSFDGVVPFIGALVRITAQDLGLAQLTSFSAYRFLYERLLGAAARPFLPAAFCGAAALPQIRPDLRRDLLQSLSESAATAPAWSSREPAFYPEKVSEAA